VNVFEDPHVRIQGAQSSLAANVRLVPQNLKNPGINLTQFQILLRESRLQFPKELGKIIPLKRKNLRVVAISGTMVTNPTEQLHREIHIRSPLGSKITQEVEIDENVFPHPHQVQRRVAQRRDPRVLGLMVRNPLPTTLGGLGRASLFAETTIGARAEKGEQMATSLFVKIAFSGPTAINRRTRSLLIRFPLEKGRRTRIVDVRVDDHFEGSCVFVHIEYGLV
jgi:hypothetical protein